MTEAQTSERPETTGSNPSLPNTPTAEPRNQDQRKASIRRPATPVSRDMAAQGAALHYQGANTYQSWVASMRRQYPDAKPGELRAIWQVITRTPRPDLANPMREPGTRPLTNALDATRETETRSDADVQDQADKISDAGIQKRLLDGQDGQLSDAETVAARRLLDDRAVAALQSGDPAALNEVLDLEYAYRDTGTEQARAFRQRREAANQTPQQRSIRGILDALLKPTKQQQRQINRINKRLGARGTTERKRVLLRERKKAIRDQHRKDVEKWKRRLRRRGYDVSNLDAKVADKYRAAKGFLFDAPCSERIRSS